MRAGRAEGGAARERRVVGALAVGEGVPVGLAEAPVVSEARGAEHRAGVAAGGACTVTVSVFVAVRPSLSVTRRPTGTSPRL